MLRLLVRERGRRGLLNYARYEVWDVLLFNKVAIYICRTKKKGAGGGVWLKCMNKLGLLFGTETYGRNPTEPVLGNTRFLHPTLIFPRISKLGSFPNGLSFIIKPNSQLNESIQTSQNNSKGKKKTKQDGGWEEHLQKRNRATSQRHKPQQRRSPLIPQTLIHPSRKKHHRRPPQRP